VCQSKAGFFMLNQAEHIVAHVPVSDQNDFQYQVKEEYLDP
jgi:hypothetical protein